MRVQEIVLDRNRVVIMVQDDRQTKAFMIFLCVFYDFVFQISMEFTNIEWIDAPVWIRTDDKIETEVHNTKD